MTTIADGLKDVFLAGVGAMALGAEKTQELVESLIAKGEITVEQGKAINSEVLSRPRPRRSAWPAGPDRGRQRRPVRPSGAEPSDRSGQDRRMHDCP